MKKQKSPEPTLADLLAAVQKLPVIMGEVIRRNTSREIPRRILQGYPAIGDFIGISASTVRRWKRLQALPVFRIGRKCYFDADSFLPWMMALDKEKRDRNWRYADMMKRRKGIPQTDGQSLSRHRLRAKDGRFRTSPKAKPSPPPDPGKVQL